MDEKKLSIAAILNIDSQLLSMAFCNFIFGSSRFEDAYNEGEDIYDPADLLDHLWSISEQEVSLEVEEELNTIIALCEKHRCKYFKVNYWDGEAT